MVKRVSFAAISLFLLVGVVEAQTSLGALRVGNDGFGGAIASTFAGAGAGDECGQSDDAETPVPSSGDTSANSAAQASAFTGTTSGCGASATEQVLATALITGPSNTTVYAPEATASVGHNVGAAAPPGGFAFTNGGGLAVPNLAQAFDNYQIDDATATAPCITGYIDVIVSSSSSGTANADSGVNATVGGLNIISNPGVGYNINWNGNLVEAIVSPDPDDINIIIQLIDCAYAEPVPLAALAQTNTNDTAGTGAWAPVSGQGQSSVSVLAWFEAEDFGANPPAAPRVTLQHRDEEGHPDGDPIEVDLPDDDPPGGG